MIRLADELGRLLARADADERPTVTLTFKTHSEMARFQASLAVEADVARVLADGRPLAETLADFDLFGTRFKIESDERR